MLFRSLILSRLLGELEKAGIRRLEDVGAEIQRRRNESTAHRRLRPHHIILLASNETGLRNLYRLVTASYLDHFRRNPIVPKSEILRHRDGLIIGAACESGEVFGAVSDRRSPMEQRRLAEFYDYLEIQPLTNNRFMLLGEHARARDDEDLRNFNRRVVALGEEIGRAHV